MSDLAAKIASMSPEELAEARKGSMAIEEKAWQLVAAFDAAGEKIDPPDRRVTYSALVMLMTTFVRSSPASATDVLHDFCQRIGMGLAEKEATRQ